MKGWHLIAAVTVAGAVAAPACAQENLRRFTEYPLETNHPERLVYVPLGWAFPGRRPAEQPYDVSAATWYLQPLGSAGVKPSKVLGRDEYVLERFGPAAREGASPAAFRVVITRRPAPAATTDLPRLEVVHPRTRISAIAFPSVEPVAGGVRYTYTVTPPYYALFTEATVPDAERFEIRFMPARGVQVPKYITRAPTFGGMDRQTLAQMPPPRLTVAERVAGKRIEYRTGKVIDTRERVAGERQERRR
jgi:hypothetical protein